VSAASGRDDHDVGRFTIRGGRGAVRPGRRATGGGQKNEKEKGR